jgi:pimeloyl-ACP methyl ester carboxylesterase
MKDLLLLHGALASKKQFDSLLPLLAPDFQGGAIDFSGHGGTVMHPLGYSFPVFASDILTYLDANAIRKVNLFGFSMGGYAALYFAKLHPERVSKIFTLNVKFNWDPSGTQQEIAMLNAENMLLKVPTFANNLMIQHGMDMWKQVLQQTRDMMVSLSRQHFLADADFTVMNTPVLLGIGDRDTTSSVEETLHVYRKLKNSELLVLPNTPHPFEKINPAMIHTQMIRFFGS